MLLGDQPISSSSQDRLDRADFCKYLAGAISGYKSSECIVLGLLGTWGSGKSSILNMTVEFLEKNLKGQKNSIKPIIVRFNPWNYPDPDKIVTHFFYNLSSKLKSKRLEKLQKLGNKVSKYADSFIPFEILINSPKRPESLKIRKTSRQSIDSKKEALTNDFQKIDNKIIIIIDDVDRLNKSEIRKIFQLTKAFGNLPNIIYIVAFDRKIVSQALSDDQLENGEEYLEKIIQVPFEIPSIPKDKVLRILQFQLNEIIDNIPKEIWDQEYWYSIYHAAIRNFFRTIRDTSRYINTLKISLPFIINEVNPIDFIAITCLQVFLPKVYFEIKNNKNLLIETIEETPVDDYNNKSIENIIESIPKDKRECVKRLLCYLFPRLREVLNFQIDRTVKLSKSQKERRIHSPNFFDTYFRLSVPEYEVTQVEMNKLIEFSNSESKFSLMLLSLNEKGKIQVVIENLRDRIKEISIESMEIVINSLLDISDNFIIEDIYANTFNEIVDLCINLLFRIEDESERFNKLENAIKKANSIYISTLLAIKLIKESKRTGKFLIDGFKVIVLEDLIVGKIRKWISGNNIEKHPMLHAVIYSWYKLETENQAKIFLNKYIKTQKGFIAFVTSNLQKKYILKTGGYLPTIEFIMDTDKMINFIDMPLDELKIRVNNIIDSKEFTNLNNKEKIALKTFIRKISKITFSPKTSPILKLENNQIIAEERIK